MLTINADVQVDVQVDVHNHGLEKRQMDELRETLNQLKETIMANQAETAQQLRDTNTTLLKAAAEISAQVVALETAVANAGNSTPELDAAVADLKTTADALDALNPDTTV